MFKKLMIFLGVVIVIPLLGILLILILGRSELRKQERAYLAVGGILDAAQFRSAPLPDEVNAAKHFEPIFEFLDQLTTEEQDLLGDEEKINDPALRALLLKCDETISALRLAARVPQCNWEIQYGLGIYELTLPHLSKLRIAGKLLASNIHTTAARALELGEKRAEFISQDIEAILHLARHCSEDSTFIGRLVTMSLVSLGIDLYQERFADHLAPSNNIAEILALIQPRLSVRRVIQCETITAQVDWKQVQGGTMFSDRNPWFETLFRDWERAAHLEWVQIALQNSERPFHETMIEFPDSPWYAEAADELSSSFGPLRKNSARLNLKIELFKTAEQLRAYKAEHGSYPQPGIIEMPSDPVTGKPLQYEIVNDGFKLTGLVGYPDKSEITWSWAH